MPDVIHPFLQHEPRSAATAIALLHPHAVAPDRVQPRHPKANESAPRFAPGAVGLPEGVVIAIDSPPSPPSTWRVP